MVTALADLPVLPAVVDGLVSHGRRDPLTHAFRHRVYQWLVDLDDVPCLPPYLRPVARFDARDHLGGTGPDASATIKTNVENYLAHHDIDLGAGGRIVMLAQARVLGHVFNPLTVFWCFTPDGALHAIVAEVHNTYGERHAYLLRPGPDGAAVADKQFYVSPFNDLSGRYEMRFELTRYGVRVGVSLVREGQVVFEALLDGVPAPATRRTIARTVVRMPLKVSALIRGHGIWLWLRRLPIVKRPTHHPQEGV